MAFAQGLSTWVAFYRTTDSGITWQLQSLLSTHSDLVQLQTAGTAAPTDVAGAFPVVAIAGPQTYWVLGTSSTGARTVSVTTDGGTTWTSKMAGGIPTYTPSAREYASQEGFISLLEATSPARAWIDVTEGSSLESKSVVLLGTQDGGQTWSAFGQGAPGG